MSEQSSYPPPQYGPPGGPPSRSRGPLILVIALGLVLVAVVAIGAIVLLGRSDSNSSESVSGGPASSPESVQFRAVLSTTADGCKETPATTPAGTACGPDGILYTLDKVALDGTHVTEVKAVESAGGLKSWVVELALDSVGEQAFTKLTTELSAKPAPQNMLAIVVRGRVISAPTVMAAIPNGRMQIAAPSSKPYDKAAAQKLVDEITG